MNVMLITVLHYAIQELIEIMRFAYLNYLATSFDIDIVIHYYTIDIAIIIPLTLLYFVSGHLRFFVGSSHVLS